MSIKGIWKKFLNYMLLPELPDDDYEPDVDSDTTALESSEIVNEKSES